MQPSVTLPHQTIADYRAAALSAGRYDLMAMEYSYPLTIFLRGEAVVVRDPAEVERFYAGFHTAMRGQGLYDLNGRVTAEDLPRGGRFRIWTDWSSVCQAGNVRAVASTVCYCTAVSGLVLTEMVEFTRLSLPLLFA